MGYANESCQLIPPLSDRSPRRLEERDGSFSRAKASIEGAVRQARRPALVLAHSMGNLWVLRFLHWLRHAHFRGDETKWRKWIDTHLVSWPRVAFSHAVDPRRGCLFKTLEATNGGIFLFMFCSCCRQIYVNFALILKGFSLQLPVRVRLWSSGVTWVSGRRCSARRAPSKPPWTGSPSAYPWSRSALCRWNSHLTRRIGSTPDRSVCTVGTTRLADTEVSLLRITKYHSITNRSRRSLCPGA